MNETEKEEEMPTSSGSSCWKMIVVVSLSIGAFFKTCAGCFKAGSTASKIAVTSGKIAVGTGSVASGTTLLQQEQQATQTARNLKNTPTTTSSTSKPGREAERTSERQPSAKPKKPITPSKVPPIIGLEQQTTAKKLVQENLSFKVYNSSGEEVGVLTSKWEMKDLSTKITTKVFNAVEQTKVTSQSELIKLIEQSIKKEQLKHGKMLVFNVSTGELQLNLESNSARIEGAINMYNTILKAVGLGAGGYYVLNPKKD